ncbi:OmpA family protein [Pseudoxanthomonas dokdonensis]|uniref:OmpA family protein n=1 Tax=Pseudoxanthomonas dokdonensis TaxID=344882 RepID=UPI001FE11D2F|nr:OmpA family protein [Pseudoxanthomonas dokdonensis]
MLPVNGWLGGDGVVSASAVSAAHAPASTVDDRLAKVYFDVGSAVVPADASTRLSAVLGRLHTDPASRASVSGFHDRSGDAAFNQELSKQRAQAIAQWLLVNGVSEDRIALEKPVETTGDGDPMEARRVEVQVR